MNSSLTIRIFICFIISSTNIYRTYAQWTSVDSVWLQNILSGKDSVRLNPETVRAIESGTFLNPDQPIGPAMSAPAEIPIIKDFSEYFKAEDTVSRKVALKDLPPSVFWYYGRDLPLSPYQVNPVFNIRPHLGEHVSYPFGISFNHLLQTAFNPTYRNIRYNRKNAVAWKTYDDLPSKELSEKQKKYRKEQDALPLPLVKKDTIKPKKDSIESKLNIVPKEYILSIHDSMEIPGDSITL